MDVLMPQLGETVAEGKISKWFVSAGDAVKPGDNLFEIETDKVSMEVPAITAGTIAAINVQAGEVAPVGAVVAIIQGKSESVASQTPQPPLTPAKAGVQKKEELISRFRGSERSVEPAAQKPVPMEPFREVRSPERNYVPARLPGGTVVTPLARRLAGEAGIDLARIKGSGPHGRIVARDVEQAHSAKAHALPQAQTAAHIVVTADLALEQSLALCADVPSTELADVIIKAWAAALVRLMPSAGTDIAVIIGKSLALLRNGAGKSLTAISAARRGEENEAAKSASSAISMPNVPGIVSIADVLQPPQSTLLSL